jgi:large subunit ribosomal protein L3
VKALIGRKLGMTQLFNEDGTVSRVTVLQAGPCVITQVKTGEVDGYQAVQIGFGKAKNPTKPAAGHAAFDGVTPQTLHEFRMDKTIADVDATETDGVKVGDQLTVEQFEVGDRVQVVGTSKGKGFAGTVKRHNFATGPKTHGSHNYRAPGSIGAGYPQHVQKGMRMAGRMGGDRITLKGLKVITIDATQNLIAVSGSVPGPRRGLVMVRGL